MAKKLHLSSFDKSVRRYWRLIILEGAVLVVLGLIATLILPYVDIALTRILGWLILVSGLVGLVTTAAGRRRAGFWWSLLSALVAVGVGIVLMEWEADRSAYLAAVLAGFFLVEGIATILFAIEHRRRLTGRWEWLVASGCVDVALAGLVYMVLPEGRDWAIALLVGINMVFGGSALIAMAIYEHYSRLMPGMRA